MIKHSLKTTVIFSALLAFLFIFASCAPTTTDTDTKTNIDTETEVTSDSETNGEDIGSGTSSDTENDTDTEADTDTDLDTDENSDTETDSASDFEAEDSSTSSDKYTETDTKTDTDTESSPDVEFPTTHQHVYDILFDVVSPTCTTSGHTIYVCECGDEITTDYRNPLGHLYINAVEVPPTCTESGCTLYFCNCGLYEAGDYVDPLGHTFGDWYVSIQPTTTQDGEERCKCSVCDEYETKVLPKISLYYSYSKDGENDVLTVSAGSPIAFNAATEPSNVTGTAVGLSEVEKLVFGENITEIFSLFGFSGVKTIVFSAELEKLDAYSIYNCEMLDEIYFEGNAPTIENVSLATNGQRTVTIIPSSTSTGFGNGFFFGGQPLYRDDLSGNVPQMSLSEYAQKTAYESVELTKDIVNLFKSKNQEALLLLPYTVNMNEYVEIKNFTLDLTKDCQTDTEKANAIFEYLMENITYDDNASSHSPYQVFKTKTAVCAGYVGLMHDMLSSVGIASFYTRGMTLSGCTETPETLLKETYTSSTHAWLTVYFSNGDVKFYDPTWGVDLGDFYMEMSADELGTHVATFEVSGLEVLIDEVDFSMLGGFHQFLHIDGNIYNTLDGKLSLLSGTTIINDWFLDIVKIMVANSAEIYIDGTYQELGTAINNGLYSYYYNDASQYYFAAADGKIYQPYTILNFLYTELTVYDNEFSLELNGLIIDETGIVYAKDYNGTYGAIAYLGTDTEITVPATILGNKVVSVNSGFLENNSTPKKVVVSEGIKYVARYAFNKCTSLEYVYLPSTLEEKSVNQYIAFADCPNLKAIEISNDSPYFVTVDGNLYTKDMKILLQYAPKNDIKNFILPSSVEIIWEEAFHSSSLKYITLHEGLKEIKSGAFKHSSIREITIPKDCIIGPSAFWGSAIRRAVIEDGITEIGAYAFFRCQMLTYVKLPSTLIYIPEYAFSENASLYEITLPSSVERIDAGAFSDSGLTSITLSSSLNSIADGSFEHCYSLYHINNLSSISFTKGSEEHGNVALFALSISSTIETHVSVLDNFVFYVGESVILTNYVGDERNISLPSYYYSKTYTISPYAFAGSSSYISTSLSYIAPTWTNDAMHYGKYVVGITIPTTITEIPEYCFYGWDSLEYVYYDGTLPQWYQISISSTGNAYIFQAEILFI